MRPPIHVIHESFNSYERRRVREVNYNFFAVAIMLVVVGIILLILGTADKIKQAQAYEQEEANWEQLREANPLLPDSPPPKADDNFFTSSVGFETINKFNVGLGLLIIGLAFLLALKFLK
ncbi:MAG: hypothetical protein NT076_04320 [Candidatus Pacearchaeota archaeon]|nr:hypothetical protein [Candidatus Pacearchaeota archaeon]